MTSERKPLLFKKGPQLAEFVQDEVLKKKKVESFFCFLRFALLPEYNATLLNCGIFSFSRSFESPFVFVRSTYKDRTRLIMFLNRRNSENS